MNVAISLYDESGNMLRPWAEAGYDCYCVDIVNDNRTEIVGRGGLTFIQADMRDPDTQRKIVALNPQFISGFPPCTDLATSGARYFDTKYEADPLFQEKAIELVSLVATLGDKAGCRWFFENPRSVISTMYRKPDYSFNPNEYGGWLPANDMHPRWPQYIPPRDAYPKMTCVWAGGGFHMPPKVSVAACTDYPGWKKLGGKSARTKQIRSETPRGFAKAVFIYNSQPQ